MKRLKRDCNCLSTNGVDNYWRARRSHVRITTFFHATAAKVPQSKKILTIFTSKCSICDQL